MAPLDLSKQGRHCELDCDLGHLQIGESDGRRLAGRRTAYCLLADVFAVAMEISHRVDRGAAAGAPADRAGVLYFGRHWAA